MKIAVVGAGAIGGYLGARLAIAGETVTFVARNRNLEAIRARGFHLINEDGSEQRAESVRAVQQMAEAGPQDVVLLTVKAHQVRDLLPQLRELFGPHTAVVTMINGVPWWYFHKLAGPYEGRAVTRVDPDGAIAAAIEPERVIGSVVYPAAELLEPGVVKVIEGNRFTLGEPDGSRSERVETAVGGLQRARGLGHFRGQVGQRDGGRGNGGGTGFLRAAGRTRGHGRRLRRNFIQVLDFHGVL